MSETLERYIETIHELEEKGRKVRTKDIARDLKVKEPSVTEMLRKLKEKDLVEYEPYQGASLTQKGKDLAKKLMKKHATFAEFLKMIGVDGEIAEEDACRIEHVVNPETVGKLRKFLKFVEKAPEEPIWLEHYRDFIKTGKHPECDRKNED